MTKNLEAYWEKMTDVCEILGIPKYTEKGELWRLTPFENAKIKEYLWNLWAGNPNKGAFKQKYKHLKMSSSQDE